VNVAVTRLNTVMSNTSQTMKHTRCKSVVAV